MYEMPGEPWVAWVRLGAPPLDRGRVALDLVDVGLELLLLELRRPLHRALDLRAHVGHGYDDRAGLAGVEVRVHPDVDQKRVDRHRARATRARWRRGPPVRPRPSP